MLPLSLFEAVRDLDLPPGADLDDFHRELTKKRLGTSPTVAAQISRYARLVDQGRVVGAEEFVAVLRLIGRRSDANLVFADAGRRAGRHALRLTSPAARLGRRMLAGRLGQGAGFRLARRAARRVFALELTSQRGTTVGTLSGTLATQATPNGAACGFYGSAVAEILRAFTAFDGAVLHTHCRARSDPECRWQVANGTEV